MTGTASTVSPRPNSPAASNAPPERLRDVERQGQERHPPVLRDARPHADRRLVAIEVQIGPGELRELATSQPRADRDEVDQRPLRRRGGEQPRLLVGRQGAPLPRGFCGRRRRHLVGRVPGPAPLPPQALRRRRVGAEARGGLDRQLGLQHRPRRASAPLGASKVADRVRKANSKTRARSGFMLSAETAHRPVSRASHRAATQAGRARHPSVPPPRPDVPPSPYPSPPLPRRHRRGSLRRAQPRRTNSFPAPCGASPTSARGDGAPDEGGARCTSRRSSRDDNAPKTLAELVPRRNRWRDQHLLAHGGSPGAPTFLPGPVEPPVRPSARYP